MRRFWFLLAGAALWLFLFVIPALADGGPHLTLVNSGSSSLTADSCAGCHRAHTAQGEFLLKAESEEALCLSCHNGTGATTNVEMGLQYVPDGDGTPTSTVLGALRDGGFLTAYINSHDPARVTYQRGYEDAPFNLVVAKSQRPKVGAITNLAGTALGTPEAITSAHIDLADPTNLTNGIADQLTVWGKGVSSTGTPGVTLTCVECHNPHGNGNYRILRPVPGTESDPLGSPTAVPVKETRDNFDYIVTASQHGLVVGDTVQFKSAAPWAAGLSLDTDYTVVQIVNGFTFKVGTFNAAPATSSTVTSPADWTVGGTPVSVVRLSVSVADVPVDPDGDSTNGIENPTKNYTILQTKGAQGVNSTFLLYARDVLRARNVLVDEPGVDQDQDPVSIVAVNTSGTTYVFQTVGGVAHGLAQGDLVTMSGSGFTGTGTPLSGSPYTVASVSSSGTNYDRFTLVGVSLNSAAGSGSVVRNGIPGTYTEIGGDYFHRGVPWSPSILNSGCKDAPANATELSNNSSYCAQSNDAPNGRPNAIGSGGPSSLLGQQAFNDQITTWCSQCHTRYYSGTNEQSGVLEPSSTIESVVNTFSAAGTGGAPTNRFQGNQGVNSTAYPIPGYGDRVYFRGFTTAGNLFLNSAALPALPTEYYVVATGGSGNNAWFQVSGSLTGAPVSLVNTTGEGTVYRTYQSSASSWWYSRDDSVYRFQHQTTTNRACVTCHVSHGSNATMVGQNGTDFSAQVPYPGGLYTGDPISYSSRLLKVDNRGTCQMCHDPTGTIDPGTIKPDGYLPFVP